MAQIPIGQQQRQANMAGIIQFVGLGPAIPIGWFVTYKLIIKKKNKSNMNIKLYSKLVLLLHIKRQSIDIQDHKL